MERKLDGLLRGPRSLLCWPVCPWWVRHTLSSHRLLASESQPPPQIWIHLQNSRNRNHISPANSLWMVFEDTSMIKSIKKKKEKKSTNIYWVHSIHKVLSTVKDTVGEKNLVPFFFLIFILYWSRADLQRCVSLRCMANVVPFLDKLTASLSNHKRVSHIRL